MTSTTPRSTASTIATGESAGAGGWSFVNPSDVAALGLTEGDRVDLVSEFNADGRIQERRAEDFLVVPYPTPPGNAAAYYPETNPLVPLDHVAAKSNTPVSKAIVVRLERASRLEKST